MNAPILATVADTGRAIRLLTAEQVTAGAVLEQALRSAHGTEVLLHDFVGAVTFQAERAAVTEAQRTEAREIARNLLAHAAALYAMADSLTVEG